MEDTTQTHALLDLMTSPAFCVRNNQITAVNPAARGMLFQPGLELSPLLETGREEYAALTGGCLYLTLEKDGQHFGAAVSRLGAEDIFLLDSVTDEALQAMSLAAMELRNPLSNLMIAVDRLDIQDEGQRQQLEHITRSIQQLQRIIGNMSDAGQAHGTSRMEMGDFTALFRELMEKAQVLLSHKDLTLTYQIPAESALGLMDRDLLERAVWNMLSNALKFTPAGGKLHASLTRQGRLLTFHLQDSGSGIAEGLMGNLFHRYQRGPGIEDSRFGLGLGMVIIRNAATQHGGTVLIDQPESTGTRVTLTLPLRQSGNNLLRSPRVDYAGEQDHGLLELSECLPAELYRKNR